MSIINNRKIIEIEGDNSLINFFQTASIGIFSLSSKLYDIPYDFIKGDIYRDKKFCIFIESDSYIKSNFVTLSISKPRFFDKNKNTIYIGLKDFISALIQGEDFTYFELVNSWDMKNHEIFNYIYKYNEWLFNENLIKGLIHRIYTRKLNNIQELNINEKWNGIIDLIFLTTLLNNNKRNVFKLGIGDLEIGNNQKLKNYIDSDKEENKDISLSFLIEMLLSAMPELENRLEQRLETSSFLTDSERVAYLSRTLQYMDETLQEHYYLDRYFNAKFPTLEGCCELMVKDK